MLRELFSDNEIVAAIIGGVFLAFSTTATIWFTVRAKEVRIERADGSYVKFSNKELRQAVLSLQKIQYAGPFFNMTLEDVVRHGLGAFVGESRVSAEESFLLLMASFFDLDKVSLTERGFLESSNEEKLLNGLLRKIIIDLNAMNVIYDIRRQHGDVEYENWIITNFGKAIIKKMMAA